MMFAPITYPPYVAPLTAGAKRKRTPWGITKRPQWGPKVRRPAPKPLSIRPEFKCKDTTVNVNLNTTAATVLLSGIGRGDDMHERIGREVMLKSIQYEIKAAVTSGTGVDQEGRIMIVYDKQCNGAVFNATDVLTAADTTSFRNLTYRKRFWILSDEHFTLNASAESGSHLRMKYYRRVGLPITFNANDNGDVTDISTGSLYLLIIGSQAAGVTAGTVTGSARVRFIDM